MQVCSFRTSQDITLRINELHILKYLLNPVTFIYTTNLLSLQVVSQARMENKATDTEELLQQATNLQNIPSVLEKNLQEKETEYDDKVFYDTPVTKL